MEEKSTNKHTTMLSDSWVSFPYLNSLFITKQ